jgi:hypothetical protein
MFNHRNPEKSLAERHQYHFALSFQEKAYREFAYFDSSSSCILYDELPLPMCLVPAAKRPFKLNKGLFTELF